MNTIGELDDIIHDLKAGESYTIHPSLISRLWPTPPVWRDDEGLTDKQRAEKWCNDRDCNYREQLDPNCVVITKRVPVGFPILLMGGPCAGQRHVLETKTQTFKAFERNPTPIIVLPEGPPKPYREDTVTIHHYTMHPHIHGVYIWEQMKPYPTAEQVKVWVHEN